VVAGVDDGHDMSYQTTSSKMCVDVVRQGLYAYDKFGEGLSFNSNGSTLAIGA
jgi:hypothetical protein